MLSVYFHEEWRRECIEEADPVFYGRITPWLKSLGKLEDIYLYSSKVSGKKIEVINAPVFEKQVSGKIKDEVVDYIKGKRIRKARYLIIRGKRILDFFKDFEEFLRERIPYPRFIEYWNPSSKASLKEISEILKGSCILLIER